MNADKKLVIEQFGKAAEAYVRSKSHGDAAVLAELMQHIEPQSDWVGLDIATGGGHVAKAVAPFIRHVFATDITKEMLVAASNHIGEDVLNVSYVLADAEALPFLDATFHLVTCRIAPHHFPNPSDFIDEVHRVLKPNGLFVLVDNTAPENDEGDTFLNTFEKLRDKSHQRCLKISEWKSMMAAHGFVNQYEDLRSKPMNFAIWLDRMVDSEEVKQQVRDLFLTASPNLQEAFSVVIHDGNVSEFAIDEWTIIAKKPGE